MSSKAIGSALQRFLPEEGWPSFLLLFSLVLLLNSAVAEVKWTPEAGVVGLAAAGGLLLGVFLANRPVGWRFAWGLLLLYGLVFLPFYLGRLWPPWDEGIRQNWALMVDRTAGWLEAVAGGNRTTETIVFSFGIGLLAWLLSSFAAWSVFRQRRPLSALSLMGLALGVNSYFGSAPLWPAAVFVGLAVLLVAAVHLADAEHSWTVKGVDYSLEIRRDLFMYSVGIALTLFSISLIVPAINLQVISQAILNRPELRQAEEALDRAFAGVRQPARGQTPLPAPRRAGLPQSFLVGNPPELAETLVMTATVSGQVRPVTHWRGRSYDVYTGLGWAASEESEESIPAYQSIPLPTQAGQATIQQSVRWAEAAGSNRYTLGLPLIFYEEVTVYWRGLGDLSRVRGGKADYAAASRVSTAAPDDLRLAQLEQVPQTIMARYTALPNTIPERVTRLAREIVTDTSGPPSPYDQAKALERFLRQYPYSLDVDLPPAGADPVDFFLFELQAGYCDYYASAMVVLARSLGLPARLGSGFLAQPEDEDGVQSIYQINAHSWAEVYFAGYGWIEFEPTAAFRSEELVGPTGEPGQLPFDVPESAMPPPIPQGRSDEPSPWWLLTLLAPLLLGWGVWRRQRRRNRMIGLHWDYYLLQRRAERLGQSVLPSQTPAEFADDLIAHLRQLEREPLADRLHLPDLYRDIQSLSQTFAEQQYSPRQTAGNQAQGLWRRLRGPLWLLSWLRRLPGGQSG